MLGLHFLDPKQRRNTHGTHATQKQNEKSINHHGIKTSVFPAIIVPSSWRSSLNLPSEDPLLAATRIFCRD
jgi:hypothetical protein